MRRLAGASRSNSPSRSAVNFIVHSSICKTWAILPSRLRREDQAEAARSRLGLLELGQVQSDYPESGSLDEVLRPLPTGREMDDAVADQRIGGKSLTGPHAETPDA